MSSYITNFTDLTDQQASTHIEKMRRLMLRGEESRKKRVRKATDSYDIIRKNLWNTQELEMFEKMGLRPYQFQMFRPLLNSLVSRQRNRRFEFEFLPNDTQSYHRYLDGEQEFVNRAIQTDEFTSEKDAREYYENFADDHYAEVISSVLNQVRNECNAKYVESDCFEAGLIGGMDVLKSNYSTKYNREGSIEISRVPMNSFIYDDSTYKYDLSDGEFVGEVELMYVDQLVARYPQWRDQIVEQFKKYTNKDWAGRDPNSREYETFFEFEYADNALKARIARLWTLESEKRFVVFDTQTNERKVPHYNLDKPDIWESLQTEVLEQYQKQAEESGDFSMFEDSELESKIAEETRNRFQVEETYENVWYKSVFTYDTLFEFERSPFPHQSHPYTAFFAQFNEGMFSSFMDDIKDIIKAQNKALMFRELMMGHASKGMVIVNQDVLAQSNYDIDEISEAYTRIGSVVALKLKPHQRLDQAIISQTTVGQGLGEINALIQDYDMRLMQIAGVNRAQLGETSADAPASRYKLQLSEGESNNGLIYDNFIRSLELFYKKIIPMVVEMIRDKGQNIVRKLGDQNRPWLNVNIDRNFDTFAESVREGHYGFTIVPKSDDPQMNASTDAQLMQLAMAGGLPIETAIRHSNNPDKHKILKDIRDDKLRNARFQSALQVDIALVQQVASESGLDPEQVSEMVSKLQKQKYKEMRDSENQQSQAGQGMSEIQRVAKEPIREQTQTNT